MHVHPPPLSPPGRPRRFGRVRGRAVFLRTLPIAVLALTGCASGMQLGPEVSPADIPGLESRLSDTPSSVPLLVRLGRAYRSAERLDDAVRTLERAAALDATDPGVVVHLGLAYEAAERPAEARRLYNGYLAAEPSPEMTRWIQGRAATLQRQEFALAARDAVRREEELTRTPPRERHVAVLPFGYVGQDPQYAPLGRALAQLLITDLSQTDRLTVLERMQVQLLLDEIGLAERGVVDPATAARSGRLLGAEHTVLGSLDASDTEISLEAAVVRVAEAVRQGDSFSERDALRGLFDAQKRLALEVYRGLGIELTEAERERVLQHRTESLETLLAFGEGLAAEDRGDFATAAEFFRRASATDPGFQEAQVRAEEAELVAEADAEVPAESITDAGIDAFADAGALDLETLIPDPVVRDAVAETQGTEGIGRRTLLEIIIRRP